MHTLPDQRVAATVSTLLKLAWPIIVSRSTQTLLGLSDALMVAHLGETALAATTTGAMNALVFFILPMGTVFIVSSFASQYFGAGDAQGARRFAFYGLGVALAAQVVGMAAVFVLEPALGLFEFEPELLALLQGYLVIRLFGAGAVVGLEALGNYYGGLGNTRLPMVVALVAMVLNVAGNWLLIDGNLGAPALGVQGAAWASLLSSGLCFAGFLCFFLVDGRAHGGVFPRLRATEWWKTLRYGLPSGLNWFFEFFAFLFFVNVVVAGLGTLELAAMMAVIQLNNVSFMPAFAISSAGAIIVGQSIGARAQQEVPGTVGRTFLLAGGWQACLALLFIFIPEVLFAPMARGEDAAALLSVGARLLALSSMWMLVDAAATTLAEALRAAGDTAFTLWARLLIAWGVFVPGTWLHVRRFGGGEVEAIFWLAGYTALLALVLLVRFRRGAWRRFDLVGERGAA